MRAIDADDALKKIKREAAIKTRYGWEEVDIAEARGMLMAARTIEASPVIGYVEQGKWSISLIKDDEGTVFGKSIFCSVCGFFWREALHAEYFKHCPNCGAKMESEYS